MNKSPLLGSVFFSVVFLFGPGCSKEDPQGSVPLAERASAYRISAADQKLIAEKFPGVAERPSGLRSILVAPGTGTATPKYGVIAKVNYVLRFLDGRVVESSEKDNKGAPIAFPVGVGRVIKGWDEVLLEMKKGEKRTIIVPHWLGYGVTGNPPKVPPYATLVFDLELVDF